MLVKIDGKALARWRKRRNYTQTQLAEEAGISQQTLAFYETGRIQSCKRETIESLASVLNIEAQSIILLNNTDQKTEYIFYADGMYHGENTLPADLQEMLIPENDYKMSERISRLLAYIEGFRDHKDFYHCRLNIYYLVGDYFVNCDLVNFTSNLTLRERSWSKVIELLKELKNYVPDGLIDSFRSYRVKDHKERRDLLVYTYHFILEVYHNLFSKVFSLSADMEAKKEIEKTCVQIYSVLKIICLLLDDNIQLASEYTKVFCDKTIDELERGITGQSRLSFANPL